MEQTVSDPLERLAAALSLGEIVVREILVPLFEVEGFRYEILHVRHKPDFEAFSQRLMTELLANPDIEIAIATRNRRRVELITLRLARNFCCADASLATKLVRHSEECLWFQFSPNDIRKIHVFPNLTERQKVFSPNTFYILQ